MVNNINKGYSRMIKSKIKEIEDKLIENGMHSITNEEQMIIDLYNEHLKLQEQVKHYEKELTNVINDPRVPLLVGYWISLVLDGNEHKIQR